MTTESEKHANASHALLKPSVPPNLPRPAGFRTDRPQARFVLGSSPQVPAERWLQNSVPERPMPIRSTAGYRAAGFAAGYSRGEKPVPSPDSRHSNRKASTPVKYRQNQRIFSSVYIHLSAFRLWKAALRWSKSYRMVKRGHPRGRGRFSIS